MSIFNKNKAISPIIATVLLIAVAVVLVTIILSWSRNYTNVSLNKTQDFGKLKVSDADSFVYPKSYSEGTMQFIYSPPESIKSEEIIITHYQILDLPEVEPIPLAEPYNLRESTNILPLNCLYEYSLSSPDFTIQLITDKNTYITIKQRDPNMVCNSSGDGTEENPKVICNAEELDDIRIVDIKHGINNLNLHYVLGKDIDLYCFSRRDEDGWEPIGTYVVNGFTGAFDGKGFKIYNLYINFTGRDNIGLFSYNESGSEINNLRLIDFNIIGGSYVGGLTGYNRGNISNCNSSGIINGVLDIGILVGYNDGNIYYSHSDGAFYSGSYGGGLVGLNYGYIFNSYSTADISGDIGIGGLVGYNRRAINNSYSIGSVFGTQSVGGLVGKKDTLGTSVTNNSFWDMNTSGQATSAGGTGKTTAEMKTQSTFSAWDFSSIWAMAASTNSGYPYLKNNLPN